MKIYLAAGESEEKRTPLLKKYTASHRLISFFGLHGGDKELYSDPEFNIMLDSGAFSAWKRNCKIRIRDYISFLESMPNIRYYYNLDVIGNEKRTWKNQEYLERNGFSPLPVFHIGESIDSLKRCLEYEYFAFGGMVGTKTTTLCNYLDKMFRYICGNKKIIQNKIHALGNTTDLVLRRYPWYSCDSSSWLKFGAMGQIVIPKLTHKDFDFSNINVVHYKKTFKTDKVLLPYIEFLKDQLQLENIDLTRREQRLLVNAFYRGVLLACKHDSK